jgi:septum formation protein
MTQDRPFACPKRLVPLVLASASPRRRDLLAAAGWEHEVCPADVDESPRIGEAPLACCERLARDKALAVGNTLGRSRGGVLAGDTIVEVDGEMLGKPVDRQGAKVMLRQLSGRAHRVVSSVALIEVETEQLLSGIAISEVRFDELDETQLAAYLDTNEWRGKAGAYAIQGEAGAFAHLVSGEMDTVIGLPMKLVKTLAGSLEEPRLGKDLES